MKYTTIKYDFNSPNRNAITVPLNSNYGVAVKVQKDGATVELSSGQMTIDGVQEAGTKDGWLQYDLSSGSAPCTLHKQFEIKTGEASPLSGFDETSINAVIGAAQLTINGGAKLPSSMAVSPSEIQDWYAECQLSGNDGILSTWTTSYENNLEFTVTISRNSYFINSDGLWELTRSGATTSALTFSQSQPMRLTIGTSTMPLSTNLLVRYVMNSRKAPDPVRFDLTVQEKDLGYFDVSRMQPEPEPEPDPVEINGYYGEYSDSTVYSTDALIEENVTLPAAAVMSFGCSVKAEEVTDFMRIVVCDDDTQWFTKPGDPTYGNLWYEAEGGLGRTAESITLTPQTKFALLHAVDESETIWMLIYDKNKLSE